MYIRQRREKPNMKYSDIHIEEIKYWFDVLQDNTIDNIAKVTGFGRDFIRKNIG